MSELKPLPTVKYPTDDRSKEPATESQMRFLWTKNYVGSEPLTIGQASEIISNLPANDQQIAYLKHLGYDVSKGVTLGQVTLAFNDTRNKQIFDIK